VVQAWEAAREQEEQKEDGRREAARELERREEERERGAEGVNEKKKRLRELEKEYAEFKERLVEERREEVKRAKEEAKRHQVAARDADKKAALQARIKAKAALERKWGVGRDVPPEQISATLFASVDTDGSGSISIDELTAALEAGTSGGRYLDDEEKESIVYTAHRSNPLFIAPPPAPATCYPARLAAPPAPATSCPARLTPCSSDGALPDMWTARRSTRIRMVPFRRASSPQSSSAAARRRTRPTCRTSSRRSR
jgi:hypothetical protein